MKMRTAKIVVVVTVAVFLATSIIVSHQSRSVDEPSNVNNKPVRAPTYIPPPFPGSAQAARAGPTSDLSALINPSGAASSFTVAEPASYSTTVEPPTKGFPVWMSVAEANMVRKHINSSHLYLEYGSGGSTFNFGPLAAKAISIEHNGAWCKSEVFYGKKKFTVYRTVP